MQPAPPAPRLLEAAAQAAGGRLPASYAEWCALPGGDLILSRTTQLCDRFFVTRPRRVAMPDGRMLLQLMDENQGCFNNGLILDGSGLDVRPQGQPNADLVRARGVLLRVRPRAGLRRVGPRAP